MKKALLLKIVNPLLAIAFIVMAGTAVFHHQIPSEVYHSVHPAAGFTFTLLAGIHIILNIRICPIIILMLFNRSTKLRKRC